MLDELPDGTAVWGVSTSVDNIPFDIDGDEVGIFIRDKVVEFTVERKLEDRA